MKGPVIEQRTLVPGLLISMPQLDDPNFTRAVVLMLEHNEEGSFGLVVNHESKLPVSELLESIELSWTGNPLQMVFDGGPVQQNSGWILHDGSSHLPPASPTLDEALDQGGTLAIADGLYLSTGEENFERLAKHAPKRSRYILGYAGWGAGQLSSEMAQGAWLHGDIHVDQLLALSGEGLWEQSMENMGISASAVVPGIGVH